MLRRLFSRRRPAGSATPSPLAATIDDSLYPWIPAPDAAQCLVLTRELQAEVVPGHPLYGITVSLIARIDGEDGMLFDLNDGRVAAVHLTFRGKPEVSPAWPRCDIFPDLAAWRASLPPAGA